MWPKKVKGFAYDHKSGKGRNEIRIKVSKFSTKSRSFYSWTSRITGRCFLTFRVQILLQSGLWFIQYSLSPFQQKLLLAAKIKGWLLKWFRCSLHFIQTEIPDIWNWTSVHTESEQEVKQSLIVGNKTEGGLKTGDENISWWWKLPL